MRSAIVVLSLALANFAAPLPVAQKPPTSVDNLETFGQPNDRRSTEGYNEVNNEEADPNLIKPIWPERREASQHGPERREAEAYVHWPERREAKAYVHWPERREAEGEAEASQHSPERREAEAYVHWPERREAEGEAEASQHGLERREAEAYVHWPERREAVSDASSHSPIRRDDTEARKVRFSTKPTSGRRNAEAEPGNTRVGRDAKPDNRFTDGYRRRDAEAEAYNRMGHERREAGGPTRLINGD